MISVVIRNKNQANALSFLLKNLRERYFDDIAEIIVVDNLSIDSSKEVAEQFGARFVTIENFSFGGSANVCAREARFPIVVIFSAHSYPISHDFFKLIQIKFDENPNLAGLRCLHSSNDYRNFINTIPATIDPNKSGLIFSGSAFSKAVWEKYPFREDVATFEDKEWTVRVLKEGYAIDFVEAIFSYEIQRTPQQLLFRFKNDVVGNYQLWHKDVSINTAFSAFYGSFYISFRNFGIELYYNLKRFLFLILFINNKPKKF
ncbi:MAG: glycosyltransferase involved in cell wall biosynthesis [Flavobacteriales bacterium]|jgi:glycosyltransferase involved in cell wall biosynthesis